MRLKCLHGETENSMKGFRYNHVRWKTPRSGQNALAVARIGVREEQKKPGIYTTLTSKTKQIQMSI